MGGSAASEFLRKFRGLRLPFDFDRSSRVGLAKQLADGFARAIRDGLYRKGDVLPSIKKLSSALKVSEITVRGSLRRLVGMGLVSPRRGVGSVVTGDAGPLRRGRVLIVTTAVVNNFCHARPSPGNYGIIRGMETKRIIP